MSARLKYRGECECPQCGMGSKDLTENALPYVLAELGQTVKLFCQICSNIWLQKAKTEEPPDPPGWEGGFARNH